MKPIAANHLNGAVIRTLEGRSIDRCHMEAHGYARGLCSLLRPFGAVVFTFDRPGPES